MKSVVFLDLDGTLWWGEKVPKSALEALRMAQANGHFIFSNTGRSRSSSQKALEGLPLTGQVYSAGSEIWIHGKPVFCQPLGAQRARRVLDQLNQWDVAITLEGSNTLFHNAKARARFEKKAQHLIGAPRMDSFMNAPDISEIKENEFADIMKISVHGLQEGQIDDLLKREGLTMTAFSVFKEGSDVNGEITDQNLTKGTAFQTILDLLNEPYQTIALGDSENDLPMFQTADIAIAMGNGTEPVKAAADYITDTIFDDGLYKAFDRLGLLNPNKEPEWTRKER
ncbi:HAD-IIB family hydrolase [Erysipelotrichaceae bacterium RD49]|nr:HAD-IIB family hydrolase [Erysipelotrichaceae bacterium RD49]